METGNVTKLKGWLRQLDSTNQLIRVYLRLKAEGEYSWKYRGGNAYVYIPSMVAAREGENNEIRRATMLDTMVSRLSEWADGTLMGTAIYVQHRCTYSNWLIRDFGIRNQIVGNRNACVSEHRYNRSDNKFVRDAHSGKSMFRNEAVYVDTDHLGYVRRERVQVCECCSTTFLRSGSQQYCEACANREVVLNNGETASIVDAIKIEDVYILRSEIETLSEVCNECGKRTLKENMVEVNYFEDSRDHEERMCKSCKETSDLTMRNWDYRPQWNFFKEKKDKEVYFGLEIEVECQEGINENEAIRKIIPKLSSNKVHAMSDGSLGYRGIEFVTHPMTYKYMEKNEIFEQLDSCKKWVRAYDAHSAGLHIHINKSAFDNEYHIMKYIVFFAQNPQFIELMGQRKTGEYWKHERIRDAKNKVKNGGEKYVAVNTQHSKSVEIRIFRSNLRAARLKKNVQFLAELLEYSREKGLKDLEYEKFGKWVKERGQSTELIEFMENRQMNLDY